MSLIEMNILFSMDCQHAFRCTMALSRNIRRKLLSTLAIHHVISWSTEHHVMNHRGLDEILPKVSERITNVPHHIAIIILLYFTKRCFSSLYLHIPCI